MKKINFVIVCLIQVILVSSCESIQKKEIDVKVVTIGNQEWMTHNLNVEKFRNGDPIPEAKTEKQWQEACKNKQPAWCYFDNDPKNGMKYGKLYNWYSVIDSRGLAPEGFHVPTKNEWDFLIDYLGGESIAGERLKSSSGWFENGNGTNESGFSGLPGGMRADFGSDLVLGIEGAWWSRSIYKDSIFGNLAVVLGLQYNTDVADIKAPGVLDFGLSVRCIKD